MLMGNTDCKQKLHRCFFFFFLLKTTVTLRMRIIESNSCSILFFTVFFLTDIDNTCISLFTHSHHRCIFLTNTFTAKHIKSPSRACRLLTATSSCSV